MARWGITGASVAFGWQGRVVYARAFGYADPARTEPLQPYHLLRVASVSKCITAMAVMKLVEEGRLNLPGKVFGPQGYLRSPYYTQAINDTRLYDITVQQLLEHSAGWDRSRGCDGRPGCDPIDFPLYVAHVLNAPNPVGDSTLVRYLLTKGLNYAPGTHYAYSNVGYLVLGKLVEAITGQSYEAWVRQHLLEPAGAREAHLGHNLPTERLEREAAYDSHDQALACDGSGRLVPMAYGGFNLEAMGSHGGWVCSARALVQLLLAADGTPGRPGLLAPGTLAAMAQPSATSPGYAKGWRVNPAGNRWHSGEMDGTGAYVVHTAGGYSWAILLNTRPVTAAAWEELDHLGWIGAQAPTLLPTHNLQPPTQNATALTAEAGAAGVLLHWTPGTGTRRLVLLRADRPVDAFPADGTRYTAAVGQGPTLGPDTYVTDVAADTVRLQPLDPHRTYYVRMVEYADDAATGQRPVYLLEGNPTLVLPATSAAVAVGPYPSTAHQKQAVAGSKLPLAQAGSSQARRSGVLVPGRTIPLAVLPSGRYFGRFPLPNWPSFRRFVKNLRHPRANFRGPLVWKQAELRSKCYLYSFSGPTGKQPATATVSTPAL